MKKAFIFSMSLVIVLFVLTGCTKASPTAAPTGQNSGTQSGRRQPDFGQPNRQADVSGVVKSIIGNEVTILKIDRPNRNASSTPGQAGRQGGSDNATGSAPAASIVSGAGGNGGGGRGGFQGGPGGGGGAGGPGGATGDTRAAMLARLKAMSTGEETIIIPVGIRMLKVDTSNNKRTMVEATLADITADKSLTIWTATPTVAPANTNASTTDITASATNTNASTTALTTPAAASARKIAEFVLIN